MPGRRQSRPISDADAFAPALAERDALGLAAARHRAVRQHMPGARRAPRVRRGRRRARGHGHRRRLPHLQRAAGRGAARRARRCSPSTDGMEGAHAAHHRQSAQRAWRRRRDCGRPAPVVWLVAAGVDGLRPRLLPGAPDARAGRHGLDRPHRVRQLRAARRAAVAPTSRARGFLHKAIVPNVAWWFRHASTLTVVTGVLLLVTTGYLLPSARLRQRRLRAAARAPG